MLSQVLFLLFISIANSALQCNWTTFGHDNFFTHEADGFLSAPFKKALVTAAAPISIDPNVKPILYNNKFYIYDIHQEFWELDMSSASFGVIANKTYLMCRIVDMSVDSYGRLYTLCEDEQKSQEVYFINMYKVHNMEFVTKISIQSYMEHPRRLVGAGNAELGALHLLGVDKGRVAYASVAESSGGIGGKMDYITSMPDLVQTSNGKDAAYAVRAQDGPNVNWNIILDPLNADNTPVELPNAITPTHMVTDPCGNATVIVTDAETLTAYAIDIRVTTRNGQKAYKAAVNPFPVSKAQFSSVLTDRSPETCQTGNAFTGVYVASQNGNLIYFDTSMGFYSGMYSVYNVTLDAPLAQPVVIAKDKSVFGLAVDNSLIGLTAQGKSIFDLNPAIPNVLANITRPIVCDNLIYFVTADQIMVLGATPFVFIQPFYPMTSTISFNISADQTSIYPEGSLIAHCIINGTQYTAMMQSQTISCNYDTANAPGGALTLAVRIEFVDDGSIVDTPKTTTNIPQLNGAIPNCIPVNGGEARVALSGIGLNYIAQYNEQWHCVLDGTIRFLPTYDKHTKEVSCLIDPSWMTPNVNTTVGLRYVYDGKLYNILTPLISSNSCGK